MSCFHNGVKVIYSWLKTNCRMQILKFLFHILIMKQFLFCLAICLICAFRHFCFQLKNQCLLYIIVREYKNTQFKEIIYTIDKWKRKYGTSIKSFYICYNQIFTLSYSNYEINFDKLQISAAIDRQVELPVPRELSTREWGRYDYCHSWPSILSTRQRLWVSTGRGGNCHATPELIIGASYSL